MPLLVDALLKLGARRFRLTAKLCGGARLLAAAGFDMMDIGERNVQAAEAALQAMNFQIQARATGGYMGRTVRLYLADGTVTVKTIESSERALT